MAEWLTREERKNGEILKCDINLYVDVVRIGKTFYGERHKTYLPGILFRWRERDRERERERKKEFIRRLITAGKTAPQEDYEEYSKCVSVSVWVHSRKVEDFRTTDDLVVEKVD
ncbi:hypothetical protein RUM44_004246 [Polyplax serrata]|uniref:Uncharacterized protein n=1 Tax=Polyplax serrata TaxID=468196 RepID=A0ABR1B2A4_POLSC